jgi:molybdate transport system substrate-binding protein
MLIPKFQTIILAGFGAIGALFGQCADGDDATIAVATNFASTMQALKSDFEAISGHTLTIAAGSTGQIYAQIINGAPFDIYLAADQARPGLLAESGLAQPETRVTYATGQLVLWGNNRPDTSQFDLTTLLEQDDIKIALANPDLAPYGSASRDVLDALGLWPQANGRLVRGENIGQTYLLVATGNVDFGFVALSQILSDDTVETGSWQLVPQSLYDPIRQDAIMMRRAASNIAARDFLIYLNSAPAKALIEQHGYEVD